MPRVTVDVCSEVLDEDDLHVGDTLEWDNTDGDHDCKVTGCHPPLENDHYTIPKGDTMVAYVEGPRGDRYKYHCECGKEGIKSDPKLIVK